MIFIVILKKLAIALKFVGQNYFIQTIIISDIKISVQSYFFDKQIILGKCVSDNLKLSSDVRLKNSIGKNLISKDSINKNSIFKFKNFHQSLNKKIIWLLKENTRLYFFDI